MAAVYPGGSNVYVPEVTDKLVVDYGHNVDRFPVNRYMQIVPVQKDIGLYPKLTREEAGRIIDTNLADAIWSNNNPRPKFNDDMESFVFNQYHTIRYTRGFNIGVKTAEQAAFDVVAANAGIKAEQMMRGRTQLAITAATLSSNYNATNTSAVGSITGVTSYWDYSTTARNDIQRSIEYAQDTIITQTLNGVRPEDLILVISRGCARVIRVAQEITDYIKGSPEALAQIKGELPGKNSYYGLPNKLFGVELVVEDTAKTTTRKGSNTQTKSGILGSQTPFMCSRVGGLVAERASEAPSFSTWIQFMYEEMAVEQKTDEWNRLIEHSVTEDYAIVGVASDISGFLFTSATSSAF